jgi:hypothetical protein
VKVKQGENKREGTMDGGGEPIWTNGEGRYKTMRRAGGRYTTHGRKEREVKTATHLTIVVLLVLIHRLGFGRDEQVEVHEDLLGFEAWGGTSVSVARVENGKEKDGDAVGIPPRAAGTMWRVRHTQARWTRAVPSSRRGGLAREASSR